MNKQTGKETSAHRYVCVY